MSISSVTTIDGVCWPFTSTSHGLKLRCSCSQRLIDYTGELKYLLGSKDTGETVEKKSLVLLGLFKMKCRRCSRISSILELLQRTLVG